MGDIIPYLLDTLDSNRINVQIGSMSYEEDNGGKRCLECGDTLPYGRKDMKFCSSSCKNRWHYQNRSWVGALKLRTRSILDKNYSILESLLESGVTSIDIPDLAQMGYNFDCVTSYHKVRNRDEYRCYDIKYCMSASRVFKLGRCPQPPSTSSDP
ncbi:MAG: hypothetical protein IKW99_10395 [Bacteroidales bacterium]|nr:hypothetical protein [Bacteroidales bacterium]